MYAHAIYVCVYVCMYAHAISVHACVAKGTCQIPGTEVILHGELLETELWVLGVSFSLLEGLQPLSHLSCLLCWQIITSWQR